MGKSTTTYVEDTILKARCPHCGTVNAFPEFDSIYIFICHGCNNPVEVKE